MKRLMAKLALGLLAGVAIVGLNSGSAEAQSHRGGRYCPPNVAYRPIVVVPSYGTTLSVNRVTPFGYGVNYGYSSFYPSVPIYGNYGYGVGHGIGYGVGVPRGVSWGGGGVPRGASWGGGGFPPGASWGGGGFPPGASWGGGSGFSVHIGR